MAGTGQRRRAVLIVVGTALLVLVVLLVLLVSCEPDPEPPPSVAVDPAPTQAPYVVETESQCPGATTAPFTPSRINVGGILRADVMALPRDHNNVPGVPPVAAKHTFAWDQPPGLLPGAERGNVLMNAHTWPDGSAAGNAMLRDLEVGARIVVRGEGQKICYEVTERIEVAVEDGYPPFYDTEGPPQLAILVCSGTRRGPGDWSHRTIWFASPLA